VLLAADADPQLVVRAAARALAIALPPITELRVLEDADWVRQTQSQFAPIHIAERLWIVPTWHAPPEPRCDQCPPRSRRGVRHWLASDDAAVPAVVG